MVTNYERWRVGGFFWTSMGLEFTLMWSVAALYFLVHGGRDLRRSPSDRARILISGPRPHALPSSHCIGAKSRLFLAAPSGQRLWGTHHLGNPDRSVGRRTTRRRRIVDENLELFANADGASAVRGVTDANF